MTEQHRVRDRAGATPPVGESDAVPDPGFVFSDEMIERAARVLDRSYDRHEMTLQQVAREVLAAAFEEVPVTNYGIGLALQFFDLAICVKDFGATRGGPQAGVYKATGPDSFDALAHTLDVQYRHGELRSVTVRKLGEEAGDAR